MKQLNTNRQNRLSDLKLPASWIGRVTRCLSISQKIGYGYALAIGIAILGTGAGLLIGDHYQTQAVEQLKDAGKKESLVSELNIAVLEVRSHQLQLAPVMGDSVWLKYEIAKFDSSVTRVKSLLSALEVDVNDSNRVLLKACRSTIESYSEQVKYLLNQIQPFNLKPEEIQPAQQMILINFSGEVAIKLDRLSEDLTQTIKAARKQQKQAAATLDAAKSLRFKIVVTSMLLSVVIAMALAYYTSCAIARPLQAVTQVAQRVTQEANFNLQAPVTTEDEVGLLAFSFNQLTQHVVEQIRKLKQTQAQLIQTEKMSSLGQMVAGVAHEINNPVNFIYGNLDYADNYIQDLLSLVQLYQQQYPNPTESIQHKTAEIELDFLTQDLLKILFSMKIGADRLRQIVLSLRNFSRLDEAEMKPVNLHEGIDSTLLILNHRLKRGIDVIKLYGDLPLVECYPAQLNQVFMNIVNNAIDALEEAGNNACSPTIHIRTEVVGGTCVSVRISDNGTGIPLEVQAKLFNPFFTTKEQGKGTGLGLAICNEIVEKHHGKIEVFSEPGQGTEFAIALPIKPDSQ